MSEPVLKHLSTAPDKRGIEDNSKIIFLFLTINVCCEPSIKGLDKMVLLMVHNMFSYRNMENYQ